MLSGCVIVVYVPLEVALVRTFSEHDSMCSLKNFSWRTHILRTYFATSASENWNCIGLCDWDVSTTNKRLCPTIDLISAHLEKQTKVKVNATHNKQ